MEKRKVLIFLLAGLFSLCAFAGKSSLCMPNTDDGTIVILDNDMQIKSYIGIITEVKILDLYGNLVSSIQGCNMASCTYDVSSLYEGYYVVYAITPTGSISRTVKVER